MNKALHMANNVRVRLIRAESYHKDWVACKQAELDKAKCELAAATLEYMDWCEVMDKIDPDWKSKV